MQVGVLPMDESKVVMKGRLGPGMMITVDLQSGQVCKQHIVFGFYFDGIYMLRIQCGYLLCWSEQEDACFHFHIHSF